MDLDNIPWVCPRCSHSFVKKVRFAEAAKCPQCGYVIDPLHEYKKHMEWKMTQREPDPEPWYIRE